MILIIIGSYSMLNIVRSINIVPNSKLNRNQNNTEFYILQSFVSLDQRIFCPS